jgi:hypothetical protein
MKLVGLLFLSLACPALAGPDESLWIDWYTVDGGGGSTSAGEFTLSGTVGQPDAGALVASGCDFAVFGGYWGQFSDVIPNPPERPRLSICFASANSLLLSWPGSHPGCCVQKRLADAQTWDDVNATPVLVGNEYRVTLNFALADAPTYFRLRKQ